MNKLEAYKTAMIARKAAAAGMTVEAFIAKSKRDADELMVFLRLKSDRELQRAVLVREATRKGHILIWSN